MRDAGTTSNRGVCDAAPGSNQLLLFGSGLTGSHERAKQSQGMGAHQQQLFMPQGASSAFAGMPFGCGCSGQASTCGPAHHGHDGRECYGSLPDRMDFAQPGRPMPMLQHTADGTGHNVRQLDGTQQQLANSLRNSSLLANQLGHPQLNCR